MSSVTPGAVRRDVQGLRAIAVIAVFLYHLYPERFTFGYLGVDVFAVISGFVVSSVVLREVRNTGSFRVGNFVRRRARRLMPVLVFVLAVSLAIWLLMAPVDTHRDVSAAAMSAIFIGANVFFNSSSVDYFAGSDSPFIHLWSLSMEEQFYLLLIFGVSVLMLLRRKLPLLRRVPVSGTTMLSLSALVVAAVAWTRTTISTFRMFEFENLLFYFPVGRTWQFLAGIAVAAAIRQSSTRLASWPKRARLAQVLTIAVVCVMLLDQEPATQFLSWQRILVTYLTASVILLNSGSSDRGLFARRAFVAVGDRSYSIYLWHIPVIGLWQVVTAERVHFVVAVLAVLLVSEVSYRLVEQRFRSGREPSRSQWLVAFVSLALVLTSALLVSVNGLAGFVADRQAGGRQLSELRDRWTSFANRVERPECAQQVLVYECGTLDSDTDVVLVGDSHAMAISHVFLDAATDLNLQPYVYVAQSCQYLTSPALTVETWEDPSECEQIMRKLHDDVSSRGLPLVISECPRSRFTFCPDGQLSDLDPRHERNRRAVVDIRRSNVSQLANVGTRFVLVQDLPIVIDDIRRKQSLYAALFSKSSGTLQSIDSRFASSREYFKQDELLLSARYPQSVSLFDPAEILCDSRYCRGLTAEGKPVWSNEDHLTVFGSELLREPLREVIWRLVTND
ncbi:MAG: acyltransferase family protein [Actinomycetota bacterium]